MPGPTNLKIRTERTLFLAFSLLGIAVFAPSAFATSHSDVAFTIDSTLSSFDNIGGFISPPPPLSATTLGGTIVLSIDTAANTITLESLDLFPVSLLAFLPAGLLDLQSDFAVLFGQPVPLVANSFAIEMSLTRFEGTLSAGILSFNAATLDRTLLDGPGLSIMGVATPVPEPSSLLFLGLGLSIMTLDLRKRSRIDEQRKGLTPESPRVSPMV